MRPDPSQPKVLYSFANYSPGEKGASWGAIKEFALDGGDVLIDSGAYSAHFSGATVTLDGYCTFLDKWGALFPRYIQLDVIGNESETRRNLDVMRRRGFHPIPVLVMTAVARVASDLTMGFEEDGLCVAGGTGHSGEPEGWIESRLSTVHRVTGGKVWMHALGYTRSIRRMLACPAVSFDSTTAESAGRYANVLFVDPISTELVYIKGGVQQRRKWSPREVRLMLAAGLTPKDMAGREISSRDSKARRCSHDSMIHVGRILRTNGKALYPVVGNTASITLSVFNAYRRDGSWTWKR